MPEIRVGIAMTNPLLKGGHEVAKPLLERAVDCGLDHVFVADHVSFQVGAGMDGLVQAALLSGLEPTLRIGVGVYLLALRHPVVVARQIATLSQAAPGRLVFGVGVGGEDRHEIEICGVDPATRGMRTDASLDALCALLQGERVSRNNEFFQFEEAWIEPAPVPPVPILVGGRSPASFRRVARYAEGWLAAFVSPSRFAKGCEAVAEHAGEVGRSTPPTEHGLQLWVGIDEDRSAARDRLGRAMHALYRMPFEPFERYSPFGGVAEVADRLAEYVQAGCRFFNVMTVASSPEREVEAAAELRERLRDAL